MPVESPVLARVEDSTYHLVHLRGRTVYGIDDTKAICGALIHDALKTALAIAALLGTVVTVGLILLA